MGKALAAIVAMIVLSAVVLVQDVFEKADALWVERGGTGEKAKEGLKLLDDYLANNPDDFEALWRAARFCFWVCDRTDDKEVKKEYSQKGMAYAQKLIDKWPNKVEGYYFYTINLGEYGKGIGVLTAMRQKLTKNYVKNGDKAVELDKRYEQCGPLRAMGRFYFKVKWPYRDLDKSVEYLTEAVQLCPNKLRSYSYLADTLYDRKQYDEAKEVIDKGLAVSEPIPTDPWEDKFYRGELRKLLKEIEAKGK